MGFLYKQHTIKNPISFEGISIHSGKNCTVKLLPTNPNSGINFIRTDIKKNNVIPAKWSNVVDTKLCSVISNKFGVKVSTIEHLMSAISMMNIDNLNIKINSSEVPILDGSAKIFVDKINKVGVLRQNEDKKFIKILKTVKVKKEESYASLSPSNNSFAISYDINYPHPLIKSENFKIEMNKKNFINKIASARTFGFLKEHKKLKRMGLAKGANLKNCIVLNGKKILNDSGLRFKNEFVKHKVLDACGDIYLSGYSILGHFKGCQSGHYLNNQLLKKLFSDNSSFTIVNKSSIKEDETNVIAMPISSKIAS